MKDLSKLPTVFRGAFWDAGWEFDAPCVVYSPFKRYGYGGNDSEFDHMVESICIDLSIPGRADIPKRKFCDGDLKEFAWRGWSIRGFSRRRKAWHLEVKVRWFIDSRDGKLAFELYDRRESWGPFSQSESAG